MAYRRWVVDASPLILLGKIDQLQLLGALAEQIAVPRAVIREVTAKPNGERTVQTLTALESAIIVDDAVPLASILSWDLGAGETQVIGHAVMRSAGRAVIDDLEARRCAKAMGLAIISRLGHPKRQHIVANGAGVVPANSPWPFAAGEPFLPSADLRSARARQRH